MLRVLYRFVLLLSLLLPISLNAAKYNAFGLKFYTIETEHFRIHYHQGLEHVIRRVATQCENLYAIYRNTYGLTLPDKTDFVVIDGDVSNGWAFANTNTITIWTHDFDFNLRGSHDWFEDVITHEYAHIVSIQTGLKLPPYIPEFRLGFFSHPNEPRRVEVFQSISGNILPPWFTEGIAQYSSSAHGTDSWDSHRDMILRTLTLSGNLLSWDHMQVFAGRGDDYEKTYNHGFSMVKYIVDKYGEDKLVALLRESDKLLRMDFDAAMKAVFGKSGRAFYKEWRQYLEKRYRKQLDTIGTQVYGRKLNKDGYENYWPKFSSDGSKVYFLSNGKNDYRFKQLYQVQLNDTIDPKKRISRISSIHSPFDIDPKSGKICYIFSDPKKSVLPAHLGGLVTSDLFTDTLPSDKKVFSFFPKKTDKQLTERQSIFSASYSPNGDRLVCAKRSVDKFYLAITDTAGKNFSLVYPPENRPDMELGFIYSTDWAPDGKSIVFSFFDRDNRKIALYDTAQHTCDVICDTDHDERDPAFSPDGRYLYFSSDRTGIFNIYRYSFDDGSLQKITNVSGGAFAPSVSPDGKKFVYAGYDRNGYGIYLMDSITVIESNNVPSGIVNRGKLPEINYTTAISEAKPYSYKPRQFLFVPTILTEQVVSSSNDVNSGVSTFKAGCIFNILDPLTLSDLGNEIGGFFFMQPGQLFTFFNPDEQGISIKSNYDLGLYGITHMLPLTVSGDFMLRGIAGKDWYFNETEGEMENLRYRLDLKNTNLQISHFIDGDYSYGGMPKNQLALHLLGGYNRYDVNLLLPPVFNYNLAKGFRVGTMGTFSTVVVEPTRHISPRGIVAKLQYDLWDQNSLKEENSFDWSSQTPKERYDTYLFHQVTGHAKIGMGAPWYRKHTFHADLKGVWMDVLKQDTTFPSYFLPGAWLPGYSYYYRDTRTVQTEANPESKQSYDTLLITGEAILQGELSYRFPLSPKLIDKKLGPFYFERVYGALNLNFGAGWDNPEDFFNYNRDDWLLAYGCEVRLEAITFNAYPLAVKVRWDYGADRPAPIGGHRFTLSIGYDFDNWGIVLVPDYRQSSLWKKGLL